MKTRLNLYALLGLLISMTAELRAQTVSDSTLQKVKGTSNNTNTNEIMKSNVNIVHENQGKHISLVGDTYRIVISGKQTNGEYAIIDMLVPPGGGPPPHTHALIHESFYIMEGELEFKTEDGKFIAKKGDLVNIPKGGAVHCFKNTSNTTVHMICTVVPAGLDEFFEQVGTPVKAGEFLPPAHLDESQIKKLVELSKQYGQELFPPDYLDK